MKIRRIHIFWMIFGIILFSSNIFGQDCKLEKGDWSVIDRSGIEQMYKGKIRDALNQFLANYNRYADIYDEKYDWRESNFLKLLDKGNSTTPYLNDMLLHPTEGMAIGYINQIAEYFPNGFKFCITGLTVKDIRALQSDLYFVKIQVVKRTENYVDAGQVVNKERDITLDFDMIVFSMEDSEELTAAISSIELVRVSAPGAGGHDVAMEAPKVKKEPKQKQEKKEREPMAQPQDNYNSYEGKKKTRDFKMVYLDGGYGMPRNEVSAGIQESDFKSTGFHIGLGGEYWKSFSPSNKVFYSIGLLFRYHNLKDEVVGSDVKLNTFSSHYNNNLSRAPKTSEFRMQAGQISTNVVGVYAPIGLVYNFGRGNDPRVFMVQANIMPGYIFSSTRTVSTNSASIYSYYGDDSSIDNCEITAVKIDKNLTLKNRFTLAARLSPTYVYESKSWQGKRGFGFVFGLDFTLGLMPVIVTENPQLIESYDSSNRTFTPISDASFFYQTKIYHSVGGRIGIYYVLN